jgi:LPXTG-motif cell wall-anchored protein
MLPKTGSDVVELGGIGALTLLAGAAAIRIARRKSDSPS